MTRPPYTCRMSGRCLHGAVKSGIATLALCTLVSAAALAHHSFAPHFDREKPVSISGTITRYDGRNPHSYLHVAATDENGAPTGIEIARTSGRMGRRSAARRCDSERE